jgi:hypothetical protein
MSLTRRDHSACYQTRPANPTSGETLLPWPCGDYYHTLLTAVVLGPTPSLAGYGVCSSLVKGSSARVHKGSLKIEYCETGALRCSSKD